MTKINFEIEECKTQIAALEMKLRVLQEAEAEAAKPKPVKNRRLMNVVPGSLIEVKFHAPYGSYTEEVTFVDLVMTNEDEVEITLDAGYEFNIYRYANHWAYGSGADKITLVKVIREGAAA